MVGILVNEESVNYKIMVKVFIYSVCKFVRILNILIVRLICVGNIIILVRKMVLSFKEVDEDDLLYFFVSSV